MGKYARLSLTPGAAIGIWQARGRYDCAEETISRVIEAKPGRNSDITSFQLIRIGVTTFLVSLGGGKRCLSSTDKHTIRCD